MIQRSRRAPARRIAVVAFPGAQILDVVGPLEVFARANELLPPERQYVVEVLARTAGALRTQSGVRLVADRALGVVRGGIDTLLVAGGLGTRDAMGDPVLLGWLRRMVPRVRRWGSVCSGTFVLAAAGLLDGRRVTTHWGVCATLAAMYPALHVDPDPIYVRDGNLYTSAGVTAGMDLALGLLEDDAGRDVALRTARQLVVFLRRPGGQSQFSTQLAVQAADRAPVRDLQAWIVAHPAADCSIEGLAMHVGMSPRNFARVFRREVGMTPGRYVERVRVEAARRRLEESADGVETVATATGFGSAESMRRAFLRVVRVSPGAYRARFRTRSAA